MRMQAVVLPPGEVQEDVAATVASVRGTQEQLDVVPTRLLHLRLANFGKVSLSDAQALHATLGRAVAESSPMRLHFRSGTALDPMGDDSAWALLAGDVDQLSALADLVVRSVKRLGFLVDRRLPRTRMRLGRINSATTEPYLQRLIERLEAYSGPEWTCRELALVRVADPVDGGPAELEVMHRLPLRAGEPSGEQAGGS